MEDKPPEFDFDALLRSTAVETYNKEGINELMLGDMVQGLARTSSLDALPPSVIHGGVVAPEFRYVNLHADVVVLPAIGNRPTNQPTNQIRYTTTNNNNITYRGHDAAYRVGMCLWEMYWRQL